MPSDHVIKDKAAFVDAVRQVAHVAATGRLVLLGITPKVLLRGRRSRRGLRRRRLRRKALCSDGCKLSDSWRLLSNRGIFVSGARAFLQELDRLQPDILHAARLARVEATDDLGFPSLDAKSFAKAPDISVDYSVMSAPARRLCCL